MLVNRQCFVFQPLGTIPPNFLGGFMESTEKGELETWSAITYYNSVLMIF